MSSFFTPAYEKVASDHQSCHDGTDMDTDSRLDDGEQAQTARAGFSWKAIIPWILHMMLMIVYSTLIFRPSANGSGYSPCFSERLLGAPIVWEDKTYLSNIHSHTIDPYSRKNPDVDNAWKAVIDQHLIKITETEKVALPGKRDTAKAYGSDGEYAVIPEVFHQLHCLNALRLAFKHGTFNETNAGFQEPGEHADHCFSYLAQTLICHADVGVMTTSWNKRGKVFTADFNVTKQCRNFDVILNWAKGRRYTPSMLPES